MSSNSDEDDLENYRDKVDAVTKLMHRKPHNMIEEIEKLGYEWCVDDADDADEIAEEKAARPANEKEKRLMAFLEGRAEPDDEITALWRQETQKADASVTLWRWCFRAGSAQLKKLILFGLDAHPCDQILLMQLAFFHEFAPLHQEILARYARACDQEAGPKNFSALAQDFDEVADSFDYDALEALRERYAGNPSKSAMITALLDERAKHENEIVSF
jgi:hypothetical protein